MSMSIFFPDDPGCVCIRHHSSKRLLTVFLSFSLSSHGHQVFTGIANMSRKTPLWDVTGLMPSEDRPADSVCSMSSIQDTMNAKTSSYAQKYQQFVIEYVAEWEKVVRTRIDAGIKKSEDLRRDLDHYQKKVEELRLQANKLMAKGKQVKSEAAEKLKRNEEKLLASKQTYNKVATDLCILMEEVTERSWRDLHPMLIKVAQFEITLAADQSKIFGSLNSVVDQLKSIATSNGIPASPRLKDLQTLKPELLSTRPGGVANLAIEAGNSFSPTSFSGGDFSFMSAPPGSVGAQGMGGFPVLVGANSATSPTGGFQQSSSFGNNYGGALVSAPASGPASYEPPSTLNMLQISAASAPAPTLDDVYNFGSNQSVTSMPPMNGVPFQRSDSMGATRSLDGGYGGYNPPPSGGDSVYSGYSGYSAGPMTAAPSAPPPPPPMQPPPPPPISGSTYNPPPVPPAPPSWGAPPPPSYQGYQPAPSYAPPPGSNPYGQPPAPSQGGYQPFGQQQQHRPYG